MIFKDFLSFFRTLWKKRRIYLREGLVVVQAVGFLIILEVSGRYFKDILTIFRPLGKKRRIYLREGVVAGFDR